MECLLDLLANVLYPDNMELALGFCLVFLVCLCFCLRLCSFICLFAGFMASFFTRFYHASCVERFNICQSALKNSFKTTGIFSLQFSFHLKIFLALGYSLHIYGSTDFVDQTEPEDVLHVYNSLSRE